MSFILPTVPAAAWYFAFIGYRFALARAKRYTGIEHHRQTKACVRPIMKRLLAAFDIQIFRYIQVAQAHGLVRAEFHCLLAFARKLTILLQVANFLLHCLGQLKLALVEQAGHSALKFLGSPAHIAGLQILQRAGLELKAAYLLDVITQRRIDLPPRSRVAAEAHHPVGAVLLGHQIQPRNVIANRALAEPILAGWPWVYQQLDPLGSATASFKLP